MEISQEELNNVNQALDRAIETEKRNERLIESIAPAVVKTLQPILTELASTMQQRVEVRPEVIMPPMPEPQVTVNVPEPKQPKITVKVPALKVPKSSITIKNDSKAILASLKGIQKAVVQNAPLPFEMPAQKEYTFSKPMPVIITDGKGKPKQDFNGGGNSVVGPIALKDANGNLISSAYPLPISGSLATTPFATYYASDAVASQNLIQVNGNPVVVGTGYQDNALRVVMATDAVASVSVTGATGTLATNMVDSSGVAYSGTNPVPISIASATGTMAANIVDSSGIAYSGTNPFPITGNIGTVTTVTGITNTITTRLDSPDGAYSGTNPFPVTLISGALTSTIAVGVTVAGATDAGNAPVKVGGIARTTNPTAMTDGQAVSSSYDSLGRQVIRTLQVRGLIATAYATLSSNAETTFLSGVSATLLDPIMVKFANTSTNTITIDLRCGTGGAVLDSFTLPASSTQGFSIPVPYPESEVAQAWTIKFNSTISGSDISNTTVYATGLFSKEIW